MIEAGVSKGMGRAVALGADGGNETLDGGRLTPVSFDIKEKKTQPTLAGNESDTRKTVASSF